MIFSLTIFFWYWFSFLKAKSKKYFGWEYYGGQAQTSYSNIGFIHLIKYQHMEPFNIGFLPLWTVLAWSPASMLYFHFLPKRKETWYAWIIWLYGADLALLGQPFLIVLTF